MVNIQYFNSFDSNPHMEPPIDRTTSLSSALTLLDSEFPSIGEEALSGWFEENRSFARSALGSWGLTIGELLFSADNQVTLRCIVELIEQRQKDIQFRSRAKDELSALQFERDKYHSYMQQGQRSIQQQAKRMGRLQNQNSDLKGKMRRLQTLSKKQRDDDRKMIAMLRTKNQQILHEIKKKEQEINKIKEQLKKNAGDKAAIKGMFEVYQNVSMKASVKEGQSPDKFAFLLQRNQRDLSLAVKENTLLREKLWEMRQSLVDFNKWVDKQIFGQQTEDQRNYHQKFYINHQLLLKKESLTQEFNALLQVTKDGIMQLRDICRGNKSPPKKREEVPMLEGEVNFKKKLSVRQESKTDRAIRNEPPKQQRDNKISKITITKKIDPPANSQNQTPRSSHELQAKETNPKLKHHKTSMTQTKRGSMMLGKVQPSVIQPKLCHQIQENENVEAPFEDEQLSSVSSHDSSIISHISIEQMGKSRHERWDLLYQEDTE